MMRILLLFILPLFLCCGTERHQEKIDQENFFEHLENHKASKLSIQADFNEIFSEDQKNTEYISKLIVQDECPEIHEFDFKLSTRGVTRKRLCDFPPLKLNLVKDEMPDDLSLSDHPPYKLVTHCKDSAIFKQYIFREYICYKLLNVLTDKSLKAKMLNVNYQDPKGNTIVTQPGVILKNVKDFAHSMNYSKLGSDDQIKRINKKHYQLVTLFQFMIGNTDWSLSQRHNMEFVQDEQGEVYIIPYDFDYSGFVNAHYSSPHPQLPIQNVTERMLQYRGKHADELKETIELFKSKKSDIISVIDNHTGAFGDTQHVKSFIEEFYAIIETPDSLQQVFERYK